MVELFLLQYSLNNLGCIEARPEEFLLMLGLRRRRTQTRPSITYPSASQQHLYLENSAPQATKTDRWLRRCLTIISRMCCHCKRTLQSLLAPWRRLIGPTDDISFGSFQIWTLVTIHHIYMLLLLFIPRRYAARGRRMANPCDETIPCSDAPSSTGGLPNLPDDDRRTGHIGIEMEEMARDSVAGSDSSDQTLILDLAPSRTEWDSFLSRLSLEWKLVQYGSSLLVPYVLFLFPLLSTQSSFTYR
jgi:hypothetical protein